MAIEQDLKNLIRKGIAKSERLGKLEEIPELSLESSNEANFGDFSSNIAFILAKKTSQAPLETARQIQQSIDKELLGSRLRDKIEKIEVNGGGFINFFLSPACLYETLIEINKKKTEFGRLNLGQGKRIHLEFVSANPTGPLNVAHGRQAAFGDSLANILEFAGFRVWREYYLNDEGVQIDILGESVRAKYLLHLDILAQFPVSGYRGKYIDDLTQQLVQRHGRKLSRNYEKRLAFFSHFAYSQILKAIKEDLSAFAVKYDAWFSQKKLNKTGKITKALKLLKKKGFIYQKEGAWWLASSRFGDDKDRVVIKSNAQLTYIAPDIAYHQTKFKRGFCQVINVWGPDHHGYIPRIKAAIRALGYEAGSVTVLIVQLVSLAHADKIIPMSTRAGQFVSLHNIIQAVGKDMARFFFLMRKRDSHLHFDLELAKRQSLENPVFYIQYANARILNILKYAKTKGSYKANLYKSSNISLLNKPEELRLIQILRKFPDVVKSCVDNLEPHRVTTYLQELAKNFHHYYEKYRVVTEDKALTSARLVLVNAVRVVFGNCLRLLAISAPEKM